MIQLFVPNVNSFLPSRLVQYTHMDKEAYKIKTKEFEGPLELLLHLIESRKLFINDISLADVTNEYISYIKNLTGRDVGEITNFISISATLILIKARSLLPNLELTEEEKGDVSKLEERLFLYKKISESVELLRTHLINQKGRTQPLRERKVGKIFAPTPDINQNSILEAIKSVVNSLPEEKESLQEISVKITVNIDSMIEKITERVQSALNTSFSDFCSAESKGKTKEEVKVVTIVSFLALLELIREGIVDALQNDRFEDMTIVKWEEETSAENMVEL